MQNGKAVFDLLFIYVIQKTDKGLPLFVRYGQKF